MCASRARREIGIPQSADDEQRHRISSLRSGDLPKCHLVAIVDFFADSRGCEACNDGVFPHRAHAHEVGNPRANNSLSVFGRVLRRCARYTRFRRADREKIAAHGEGDPEGLRAL